MEFEVSEFAPGQSVIEVKTNILWKVLDNDAKRGLVTCEHSGPRRYLVRAIPAAELRPAA
jgi:hypothetical protein